MTGLKSAFAAIHRTNAEPELKFAAAMVASAVELAKAGDCDAYTWIEHCSLRWLYAITPAGDDCERIVTMLLQVVPEPVDCRDAATFQLPSESPAYEQLLLQLLELEM